jgi:hypothetical protein
MSRKSFEKITSVNVTWDANFQLKLKGLIVPKRVFFEKSGFLMAGRKLRHSWVKGHQDEDRDYNDLSAAARLNADCGPTCI